MAHEVQIMQGSGGDNIYVHAGGHRILVSQNNQPLEMGGFQNALTTPFTSLTLPDAHNVVHRHKANTFITIAKGVVGIPSDASSLRDLMSETGLHSFNTLEEADRAREFCRLLTNVIIRNNSASAIHWCVSDNLVSQDFYERTSGSDITILNIRPYATSSAGRLGDEYPVGMYLHGSQWVVGKMIEFVEAKVPFDWMLQVAHGFVKVCQTRGSIIPNNETFSVEGEDWTIAVFHEPAREGAHWEHVKLMVIDAPQFGIHGDTNAKRYHNYQTDDDIRARAEAEKREIRAANDVGFEDQNTLDPEDDFDLAIMEKLRLKKQAEQNAPKMKEQSNINQEPWEQPRQNNDLAALRELARSTLNADQTNKDSDTKRDKSLFGKVVGAFSKR